MYYQIRLPLICFIITAYCFWYYQKKKRLPTRTSQVFEAMTVTSLIHLLAAVVTEYTVNNRDKVPESFNYVWHIIFLISITCSISLLLYYLLLYIERGTGTRRISIKIALLAVTIAGVIAQILLPIEYIDTEQGSYSLGMKAYSLYAVVGFILITLLVHTIRYREVIGRERSSVLLASVGIFVIISVIQIVCPYMLLTGPAMTLIVLGIMVNTEDAHLYVSYKSGLYNDLGCQEILQEHLLAGRPFRLGVYVFWGNPSATDHAMQSLEQKIAGKKTSLLCGTMADNVLLVLPVPNWSGNIRLPDNLPEPEDLSVKYQMHTLDFSPDESLKQIADTILEIKNRFEEDILHRDELTGVLRREAFTRQVEHLILQRRPFAFIMVDLDNFKAINDSYGHSIGDKVLKFTADTFRATLRDTDIVCRMGGDEFSLILNGVTDPERVQEIMQRIMDHLVAGCSLPDEKHTVRLSAGIKIYRPQDGTPSFQELYAEADAALYRTKYHGKNGISFAER